jgi:ribosomal protein S18 acetylase RimI-like enzyme
MADKEPRWSIVSIQAAPPQARDAFDCGKEPLNSFLRRFARQNDAKGIGKTWVALDPSGQSIAGCFTLGAAQITFQELPETLRRRLPAYPIPAVRLSRLAVDRRWQGHKLGELLLGDAVRRGALAAEQIGILLMVVDAKDSAAAAFYAKYGFLALPDAEQVMVMWASPLKVDTWPSCFKMQQGGFHGKGEEAHPRV